MACVSGRSEIDSSINQVDKECNKTSEDESKSSSEDESDASTSSYSSSSGDEWETRKGISNYTNLYKLRKRNRMTTQSNSPKRMLRSRTKQKQPKMPKFEEKKQEFDCSTCKRKFASKASVSQHKIWCVLRNKPKVEPRLVQEIGGLDASPHIPTPRKLGRPSKNVTKTPDIQQTPSLLTNDHKKNAEFPIIITEKRGRGRPRRIVANLSQDVTEAKELKDVGSTQTAHLGSVPTSQNEMDLETETVAKSKTNSVSEELSETPNSEAKKLINVVPIDNKKTEKLSSTFAIDQILEIEKMEEENFRNELVSCSKCKNVYRNLQSLNKHVTACFTLSSSDNDEYEVEVVAKHNFKRPQITRSMNWKRRSPESNSISPESLEKRTTPAKLFTICGLGLASNDDHQQSANDSILGNKTEDFRSLSKNGHEKVTSIFRDSLQSKLDSQVYNSDSTNYTSGALRDERTRAPASSPAPFMQPQTNSHTHCGAGLTLGQNETEDKKEKESSQIPVQYKNGFTQYKRQSLANSFIESSPASLPIPESIMSNQSHLESLIAQYTGLPNPNIHQSGRNSDLPIQQYSTWNLPLTYDQPQPNLSQYYQYQQMIYNPNPAYGYVGPTQQFLNQYHYMKGYYQPTSGTHNQTPYSHVQQPVQYLNDQVTSYQIPYTQQHQQSTIFQYSPNQLHIPEYQVQVQQFHQHHPRAASYSTHMSPQQSYENNSYFTPTQYGIPNPPSYPSPNSEMTYNHQNIQASQQVNRHELPNHNMKYPPVPNGSTSTLPVSALRQLGSNVSSVINSSTFQLGHGIQPPSSYIPQSVNITNSSNLDSSSQLGSAQCTKEIDGLALQIISNSGLLVQIKGRPPRSLNSPVKPKRQRQQKRQIMSPTEIAKLLPPSILANTAIATIAGGVPGIISSAPVINSKSSPLKSGLEELDMSTLNVTIVKPMEYSLQKISNQIQLTGSSFPIQPTSHSQLVITEHTNPKNSESPDNGLITTKINGSFPILQNLSSGHCLNMGTTDTMKAKYNLKKNKNSAKASKRIVTPASEAQGIIEVIPEINTSKIAHGLYDKENGIKITVTRKNDKSYSIDNIIDKGSQTSSGGTMEHLKIRSKITSTGQSIDVIVLPVIHVVPNPDQNTNVSNPAVIEENEVPPLSPKEQELEQSGSTDVPKNSTHRIVVLYEVRCDDKILFSSTDVLGIWDYIFNTAQGTSAQHNRSPLPYPMTNFFLSGDEKEVDASVNKIELIHLAIQFLLKEIPTTGCARSEPCRGRKPFDTFGWLGSKHRKPMPSSPNEYVDLTKVVDLPMAIKYRNLCKQGTKHLNVYWSKIHERGLFTSVDIEDKEMVIEYAGEVIRSHVSDLREKFYNSKGIGCYMFRMDGDYVVDATLRGNAARFINHSCEPNCRSKMMEITGKKHILIFAIRRIANGEELSYDYKFPIEGVKIPCSCGSSKCRKSLN